MHERSTKNNALDTILYEIDMLRHLARTLPEKKAKQEQTRSDSDRAEYYLGIEGFLLHLRNLLAFLMSQCEQETDLGLNAPEKWAGRPIEQREYSDLMKFARAVNDKYGVEGSTCCSQISKFLQHCTTHRHEEPRDWDIENIFANLDPILTEFEKRFVPGSGRRPPEVAVAGTYISASTATFRTPVLLELDNPELK